MNKKEKSQLRFLMDVTKTYYWRKLSYVCDKYNDNVWGLDNGLHNIMDTIERGKLDEAVQMIYNKNMADGFERLLDPDYKDWYQLQEERDGFANQQRLLGRCGELAGIVSDGKESRRLLQFPGARRAGSCGAS